MTQQGNRPQTRIRFDNHRISNTPANIALLNVEGNEDLLRIILPYLDVIALSKKQIVCQRWKRMCTDVIDKKIHTSKKPFTSNQELKCAVSKYIDSKKSPKNRYLMKKAEEIAELYGWPIGKWDVSQLHDFSDVYKVSGEVANMRAEQLAINRHVDAELARVESLSNKRFSQNKNARGKLRKLMDDNKAAAAAEIAGLSADLKTKLEKARGRNAANKRTYAKSLTKATEKFYGALGKQAREQQKATDALDAATQAATTASQAAVDRAQHDFQTKIVSLTDTVVSHAATAEREFSRLTGVVNEYTEASAKDRELIKGETKAMEADLNKALTHAIDIGEAKAKAVEQRIASHLKDTKRYLQVELNEQVERAADNVYKIIEGKRQTLADNYLSLKAYSVAAADGITDYVVKGKGRGMSSIGDLLSTVGSLGALHAKPKQGLGMGGETLPAMFSGDTIKVSGSVAAINGLVNEYTESCNAVHMRWPMGLGKYLMDKLEASMLDKGVLQVDKIEGKSGNFVFINGRSVGLSNKLSDFGELAASMSTYEQVLAKLTAKVVPPAPTPEQKPYYVAGSEWDGK